MNEVIPLVSIVTTDLAAVTRGRSVPAGVLDNLTTGVGWVPANLSLTPFNSIAAPNPWGSAGDLRIMPDMDARFRATRTRQATPFDLVAGDLVELDGEPWACCPRGQLKGAVRDLWTRHGLAVRASFEHEFQLRGLPPATNHSLSFQALRRIDPLGPQLFAALEEAGVEPECMISEFGEDQFEVTCKAAGAVAAADRAVAVRELARELAVTCGWRASFSPKTSPSGVGNGVHVHFSLWDREDEPAMYDPEGSGQLSKKAASFCAGIVQHLPALTALTAPSPPSYYRLRPCSWSAAYTWLAVRDREASLRICPATTIANADLARQFNVEYRAADATGNPYLTLNALIRAGLSGIERSLRPQIPARHPEEMSEAERHSHGLYRLPASAEAAMTALAEDRIVCDWFPPEFVQTYEGIRRAESDRVGGLDEAGVCDLYAALY